ncbi:MAG TPA: PadR family transcriptional regulator [Catenuloplanes sp.]|jgi:DNA-binding PadR family transcriptional regulator
MPETIRITMAVAQVLAALCDDPSAQRYGLELIRATGQPSGTIYPILTRLQRAGWVEASWEQVDPAEQGRPARRYYRLTPDGVVSARVELAALRQRLSRAAGSHEPRQAW